MQPRKRIVTHLCGFSLDNSIYPQSNFLAMFSGNFLWSRPLVPSEICLFTLVLFCFQRSKPSQTQANSHLTGLTVSSSITLFQCSRKGNPFPVPCTKLWSHFFSGSLLCERAFIDPKIDGLSPWPSWEKLAPQLVVAFSWSLSSFSPLPPNPIPPAPSPQTIFVAYLWTLYSPLRLFLV